MKIYCFGNQYVEQDSLALKLADILKIPNIELIKCQTIEPILDADSPLYIMDQVKDIKEITIITDVNKLKNRNTISCHDFDLQFFLKLLTKMNKIKEVVIIGLPMQD